MYLINHGPLPFDRELPIYNWFYPLQVDKRIPVSIDQQNYALSALQKSAARSRALYFHIPFCETICSFCPFVRGRWSGESSVEMYTQALIKEIEWKAAIAALHEVPIEVIFFGGGTPSLLTAEQIRRIGEAISTVFDLSALKEFTFEMEVKSIHEEKLDAMKEIGVTHARFGVQSFNQVYRDLFALTATLDQVYEAGEMLMKKFQFISFDILYGMDGQTEEEFLEDIRQAVGLGTITIDFFPINNLVTQVRLHQAMKKSGRQPKSALSKMVMRMLLDNAMRGWGFLPHNGQGYVRSPSELVADRPLISDHYCFRYHKYSYGYGDHEIIAFGASGISVTDKFTLTNTRSQDAYINSMLFGKETGAGELSPNPAHSSASKAVIMHLPYYGHVEKSRVEWQHVHPDTLTALMELIDRGLVLDKSDRFVLSETARLWYVNLMYYLTPKVEQGILDDIIRERSQEAGRSIDHGLVPVGKSYAIGSSHPHGAV